MEFKQIHLLSNQMLQTLAISKFPNEKANLITDQLKYYILINNNNFYFYLVKASTYVFLMFHSFVIIHTYLYSNRSGPLVRSVEEFLFVF